MTAAARPGRGHIENLTKVSRGNCPLDGSPDESASCPDGRVPAAEARNAFELIDANGKHALERCRHTGAMALLTTDAAILDSR